MGFLTYSPQNRAAEPKNLLAVVENWLLSNGVSLLPLAPGNRSLLSPAVSLTAVDVSRKNEAAFIFLQLAYFT